MSMNPSAPSSPSARSPPENLPNETEVLVSTFLSRCRLTTALRKTWIVVKGKSGGKISNS